MRHLTPCEQAVAIDSKPKVMAKHEIMAIPSQLKASERFEFAEKIMQTMDKQDAEIDRVWAEEALRRARKCDEGR